MGEAPFVKGQLLFYLRLSPARQANLSTAWQLWAFKFSGVHHLACESLESPTNTRAGARLDSCAAYNLLASASSSSC